MGIFDKATAQLIGIKRLKAIKQYLSIRSELEKLNGVLKLKALKEARELLAQLGYKTNTKTDISNISGSLNAADLYVFDDTKTKSQRQRDNNAVFDLLDKIERGELLPENLTADDKMALAKYSGSGGGLKARDGKTGSAHEYYTPAPIAQAMWQAISEMGFSGGKVLDPCGGSGIFGAFAPENSIVQAIEMDETSATVNRLVNGGERYHVDNASFEERANDIPDNSVDAIVTNVPFGDVSLRKHRNKDSKFKKENLQTYFVLRSLDKLKYGGLAAFIVPSSFLDGKGGKAANARVLTSQIAEFIGAYRLPNSVFGTAAADVATDVIFYRKYRADVIDKIAELQAQNPEILTQSNVMWSPYLDGVYFKQPENKKFIFGEESEIESWRTDSNGNKKKVYAVINNDSVANIAQAIKRFSGSRIDWQLLDATETQPISYQNGDTIYQNGQAYVFDGIKFNAVAASQNEAESMANDVLAKLSNPLSAFENGVTFAQALKTVEYLKNTAQHGVVPSWVWSVVNGVKGLPESKQEQQFKRVIVGLSVQYVLDNFTDENHETAHPELSLAMKARVSLDKSLGSAFKTANEAIKLHYNNKTGFSAVWRGEKQEHEITLSIDKQVEQIQYLNGTLALPIDKVRELGIDPIADDNWCVNATGTEAIKADDYFSGSLKDVLAQIDSDMTQAANDDIRQKLQRMKITAFNRAPAVSVEKMRFDLRSPFVDKKLLLQFLSAKVEKISSRGDTGANRGVVRMKAHTEQLENGRIVLNISGSTKTNNDKLLRRLGEYLKTGSISLQNTKFDSITDAQALTELREWINAWNAELDTWLKADPAFMQSLRDKANDPENRRFQVVDDESAVAIAGESGELKLHGYQNAFVRKQAREFGGINGFGVGLGKTASSLAASQYALETGTKKKVCFVVPNAVLSNWNKESKKYFNEKERENCLFVGADVDKNGKFVVNSKNYARDLNRILENRHNKIFMTQQAFEKIRLREETAQSYIDFLASVDKSFAESQNAAKDEKAKAKAANLAAEIAGNNKLENAPYFEDLGIDALVVDEAHHFKNAKQAFSVKRVKGIASPDKSNRAVDMGVKTWFIRGGNARKDGILLLTATPITNSPLEIYAMLSLAVGEQRVNKAMLDTTKGADDFLLAICEIQDRNDKKITGEDVSVSSLTGIVNLELVQNLIQSSADIKEAQDVGFSFKQVENDTISDGVVLDQATKDTLNEYKAAYRVARLLEANRDLVGVSEYDLAVFQKMRDMGISQQKLAHPFNVINRMSNALLDLEINTGTTTYLVSDEAAAQKAVDEFNKAAKNFKTNDEPDNPDAIVSQKIKKVGDETEIEYTVKAQAKLENGKVILNCNEFAIQMQLEKMLDNAKAGVSTEISPKVAALLENIKKEQAHIRYKDGSGSLKNRFAKQIIFVETLAMHTKIKRAIAAHCGIPSGKITFISGKFNSDPDEIIDVQERFNGDDDDGYVIVIANKKAEVGINLQKGCQAIHHLELNWTPDSITQRNGRGIRQGNTAEKVNVYFYEADGTFDQYKRTAINRKSDWIEQVMAKNTTSGAAAVGQELSNDDYDEMINSDGTAADFEAMLQRQAKRKQDALDRAAVKAQAVNVGIMKQANDWLTQNETPQKYIEQLVKKASADNDTFKLALRNYAKNDNKKNEFAYNQAKAVMEDWLVRLGDLRTTYRNNYRGTTEEKPVIEKTSQDDYNINVHGNIHELPENHAEQARYQAEKSKQLNLRQSAGENAKVAAYLDGAVDLATIEFMANGANTFEFQGKYYPIGTAVLSDKKVFYLEKDDGEGYVISNDGYKGFSNLERFLDYADNRIFLPNDADYSLVWQHMAEYEAVAVRKKQISEYVIAGENITFDHAKDLYQIGGYYRAMPSVYFEQVLDYLPDDVVQCRAAILAAQQ